MFEALEVAVGLASEVRVVVERIQQRSAPLADQIRRAVESVALNLGEARWRTGRDRTYRYKIAAGSAQEAHTAVRVALAWKYIDQKQAERSLALLDRIMAMTWRLTRPRKPAGK
jgi:four helix bundle protein